MLVSTVTLVPDLWFCTLINPVCNQIPVGSWVLPVVTLQYGLAMTDPAARDLLAHLDQRVKVLTQRMDDLRLSSEQSAAPAAGAASPQEVTREPRLPGPERFSGDREEVDPFLTNCTLLFSLQPITFAAEATKVAYAISHLTGRARAWGTAEWDRKAACVSSFDSFAAEVRKVFGFRSGKALSGLTQLRQGRGTVADYAIEFRTRAARSGWNARAQIEQFMAGLSDYILDELVSHDVPTTLDAIIELTERIDSRIQARRLARGANRFPFRVGLRLPELPPVTAGEAEEAEPEPEQMVLGHTTISAEEKRRRRGAGLCLYCGRSGHLAARCPVKSQCSPVGQGAPVSQRPVRPPSTNRLTLHGVLKTPSAKMELAFLVDSGAEANFIDQALTQQLEIRREQLLGAVPARALDGHLLAEVAEVTEVLSVAIGGDHCESVRFHVISSPNAPVILGYPWLREHNPVINWEKGLVTAWGESCELRCRVKRDSQPEPFTAEDVRGVPEVYRDYFPAFSKARATSLPPHRSYDCAIELREGAALPRGRLYALTAPERDAMDVYIESALSAGLIRPSSSPAGAGFFFVKKKDGSLRPCIDYRGLNDLTVKNRYPLPLLSSAFELLQGATVFSKLDLRNAYHLVRIRAGDEWKTAFNTPSGHYEYLVMPFGLTNAPAVFQAFINDVLRDFLNKFVFVYLDDILIFSRSMEDHVQHVKTVLQRLWESELFCKAEKCEFHVDTVSFLGSIIEKGAVRMDPSKVSAVKDWPRPEDRKQLQRFLGFANFYRRFIRDYSRIAAPLTALTSSKRRFLWDPAAEAAFSSLKERFSSAPILILPDPSRQFVVEVDASDVGVGAVLSQRARDGKFHPCAFFSRRLTPAEQNYDIGNRELLAVKLALEEWRQWLEGSLEPFLVWTDHKNLEYLRTAKRLNSRQARWALFFGRFNFTLSYRPGSKNIKPDALSRIFERGPPDPERAAILSPSLVVGAASWGIEQQVLQALVGLDVPAGCPKERLFVPPEIRSAVLLWGHDSKMFCHPGVRRTREVVAQRFWWPRLTQDVRNFVAACQVCAQQKTSARPPAGHLHPLSVPRRPWSHIAMDFVTGLPASQGNTVIMTVVDRFSKACHFVPLPGLPSAQETAKLMIHHIFRLHGLPRDVVSDRGPQFTSAFWREFCRGLGATVSLSSGYHPESNGQTERANQEVEKLLRCLCSSHPASWSAMLDWAEYAHNSQVSSSTGYSPFQGAWGYQPPLFEVQEEAAASPSVRAFLLRCRRTWQAVRRQIQRAQASQALAANTRRIPEPRYKPGQMVWFSAKDLPIKGGKGKLTPRFLGPFPVEKVVNRVAVRLRLPAGLRIHPTFHVSRVKPVSSCALRPGEPAAPPPRWINGGEAYTVNRILEARRRGRGVRYLVDWEGYGPEERSWVPAPHILYPTLITEFHDEHPDQPRPAALPVAPEPSDSGPPCRGRRSSRRRTVPVPAGGFRRRPPSARRLLRSDQREPSSVPVPPPASLHPPGLGGVGFCV